MTRSERHVSLLERFGKTPFRSGTGRFFPEKRLDRGSEAPYVRFRVNETYRLIRRITRTL
jgi:hypothetical protein